MKTAYGIFHKLSLACFLTLFKDSLLHCSYAVFSLFL